VIGMIFDDEILDVAALWTPLGARLNADVRHPRTSHTFSVAAANSVSPAPPQLATHQCIFIYPMTARLMQASGSTLRSGIMKRILPVAPSENPRAW